MNELEILCLVLSVLALMFCALIVIAWLCKVTAGAFAWLCLAGVMYVAVRGLRRNGWRP